MINDEICKLREKLNESIATGKDYDEIYKISVELDELIAEYYIKRSCDRIINKEKIKILM
ncbi:MAG: aspartyl-phosphate phosphatase Spo0E family protein [Clostridia bacterium]|nr:aspartyl-phosphate phosphatase Spo0E family protein [Clostridia bacterium]